MLTCQRSVAVGLKETSPHPAIHRTHKGNFTGRRAFSLPFFLTYSLSLRPFLSLSLPHTRAVISILMDVQENMNVNRWETGGEKNTQAATLREKAWEWQRTSLSVAFSWLTPSVDPSPDPLGNTARPKDPNPSD